MSFLSPCNKLLHNMAQRTRGRLNRRGAILILLLFLLPALLMVIGTAVDVSYLQLSRAEMRLAVDAASRAAADELARTENLNAARAKAIEIAALNNVAGQPLTLLPGDVQFGASTVNSNGRWIFSAGQTPTNAVRIMGIRNADRNAGGLPLFFGGLFGSTHIDSQFASVASFRTVDIALVLDRSTSMKLDVNSNQQGMYTNDPRFCTAPRSTSRWMALSQAVTGFIEELDETEADEQVALVSFGDTISSSFCGAWPPSRLEHELTFDLSLTTSRMATLSSSVWNGNTNIAAGINTARTTLLNSAQSRQLSEKMMIVMTDGRATNNLTISAVQAAANAGIKVSAITFSVDADQVLMREVARVGNGKHLHADTTQQLVAAFRELAAQTAIITD